MPLLDDTIRAIRAPDETAAAQAAVRLDSLTKPPGSLGYLEEIVRRYAAIRRDGGAARGRGAIAVFVADHGIAAEGVSAFPQAVTIEMLRNIAGGAAAISVLARKFGYLMRVVDVGVATDTSGAPMTGVIYRRIGAGTANFARGPAMTAEQARRAIEVGIEIAIDLADSGATMIGIGEMGIANSTSAAAILCAATGLAPAELAGRGTGLGDAGVRHKVEVLDRALELHREAISSGDGREILAAVGGFEIAAMAGVCIGGAARNVLTVVDGFIASAAAAAADRIAPHVRDHLLFSHRSAEGGHVKALARMGARPILDLDMRLGEGTGAALAMNLIDAALELFHSMATFDSAGVSGKVR